MRRAVLATVVLAGIAVLGFAAPAQAHNYLVTSTPAADSTLTELPASFSITTNEPLLDLSGDGSGFAFQVVDAAGQYYTDGCVAIDGATLSTGATLGAAGAYTVLWQVISEDGHPVSGEFAFTWAPGAGFEPTAGSAAPPVCGAAVEPAPEESTAPATAPPTSEPTQSAVPISAPATANLGDVLWVGGAILAVLVAGLVAFLILGRRAKRD